MRRDEHFFQQILSHKGYMGYVAYQGKALIQLVNLICLP